MTQNLLTAPEPAQLIVVAQAGTELLAAPDPIPLTVLPSPAAKPGPQPKSKFIQAFERDLGRCVYCGLDLKADYDRFMMATLDHLVPGSKGTFAREMENLVLSCRACNCFKSDFVPDPPHDPKKNRRRYISAVRAHIMTERAKKLKEFLKVTHPGMADYQ